jgi:hypothetical protein
MYSDLGAAGTVPEPTPPSLSTTMILQASTFITVTTSAAATASPAGSRTVPQWGQCGGNGLQAQRLALLHIRASKPASGGRSASELL